MAVKKTNIAAIAQSDLPADAVEVLSRKLDDIAKLLGGTAFTMSDAGEIPMVALDDVIDAADVARLDLIKIDVEGMEMSVLAGAVGILARRHPPIWVELLARDNSYAEASEFLGRYGYKPTRLGLNDVVFRV